MARRALRVAVLAPFVAVLGGCSTDAPDAVRVPEPVVAEPTTTATEPTTTTTEAPPETTTTVASEPEPVAEPITCPGYGHPLHHLTCDEAATRANPSADAPSPQARTTRPAAAPRRASGGTPPEYVKQCESGGDYGAVNPNGHYGAWQFSQGTWNSVGGTGRPDQASPAEQDRRAAMLWDGGRGASHWACA